MSVVLVFCDGISIWCDATAHAICCDFWKKKSMEFYERFDMARKVVYEPLPISVSRPILSAWLLFAPATVFWTLMTILAATSRSKLVWRDNKLRKNGDRTEKKFNSNYLRRRSRSRDLSRSREWRSSRLRSLSLSLCFDMVLSFNSFDFFVFRRLLFRVSFEDLQLFASCRWVLASKEKIFKSVFFFLSQSSL